MSQKQRVLWTPLLVCLIAAGSAFAAGPIADVSLDSSTLVFQPQIAQKGWTLTITGPEGFYFRQDFKGGAAPSWNAFDQSGLVDGVYSYELVGIPAARALVEDRSAVSPRLERNVLSGSFTVRGGVLVDAGLPETDLTKDQVILDDLIVIGSACVGQDCSNGESFGFDTIRLKENNLRIRFEDTSTSASFPSNDWQLVANDSSNGGQNRFSVEDITGSRTPFTIEAGAPTASLYVDDGGRIGLGTSTPVVEVHVKDGDTPTVRLEQDGSSGFTAQTWDLAGNETNFFIRDVTNGSTLPFRIRPGAPTSAIDVAGSGNIGIGTSSPAAKLHVENTGGQDTDDFVVLNSGFIGVGITAPESGIELVSPTDNTRLTRIEFDDGNRWEIGSGGGNTFLINDRDNAGVEFTMSGDNLSVEGTISSGGMVLNVPDYVFEPDYRLMPLAELQAFIEREKHLPNIPSAAEVKANGVNLSHMQMQLLEKIEELTLYTLEQQKTIETLQTRLESLEQPAGEE